jgi:hypothetical protein
LEELRGVDCVASSSQSVLGSLSLLLFSDLFGSIDARTKSYVGGKDLRFDLIYGDGTGQAHNGVARSLAPLRSLGVLKGDSALRQSI